MGYVLCGSDGGSSLVTVLVVGVRGAGTITMHCIRLQRGTANQIVCVCCWLVNFQLILIPPQAASEDVDVNI